MSVRIAAVTWSTVAAISFLAVNATAVEERRATRSPVLSDIVKEHAEIEYPGASGGGHLVLLSRALPIPEMRDVLLGRAPDNTVGNTAYLVVDVSQRSPLSGNVIWLKYVTQASAKGPRPDTWVANVAWNHERREAAIVVVETQDVNVWVSLHTAKRETTIGQYPMPFELSDVASWSPASPPVAIFQKVIVGHRFCKASRAALAAVGNMVTVKVTFVDGACSELSLAYSFDTNQWSAFAQGSGGG
jgi:hypothetical protein